MPNHRTNFPLFRTLFRYHVLCSGSKLCRYWLVTFGYGRLNLSTMIFIIICFILRNNNGTNVYNSHNISIYDLLKVFLIMFHRRLIRTKVKWSISLSLIKLHSKAYRRDGKRFLGDESK